MSNQSKKECPCGSALEYAQCCGQYIAGEAKPNTPEALMRSRYTAFAKKKFAYLMTTMHGDVLKHFDISAARRDADLIRWVKLEVVRSEVEEDKAIIEFKAHLRFQGRNAVMHEISQFERISGEWFYVGQIHSCGGGHHHH